MRILVTALLSAVVILGSSCGKDKNDSKDRKFVSVRLDNKIYLSENPKGIAYAPNFQDDDPNNDYYRLEINGRTVNNDIVNITMAGLTIPFPPGVYPCSKAGNSILVVINSGGYPATYSSQGSADCFLTVTSSNSITVEGTFSGTVRNLSGVGGSRTIKNAAFRAIYTVTAQ